MSRPVIELRGASLRLGGQPLWEGLDLEVGAGEFLAVLGPNGSGKTSLLKALLGLLPLSSGTVLVDGRPPRRGSHTVGYVPQQNNFRPDLAIRGTDLVRLGLDGHRYGFTVGRADGRRRVRQAIRAVGASAYADAPVGLLSGGEQQRLRIAQALVGDPHLLLCDEPLLSLDFSNQTRVGRLLDQRRQAGAAIVFVTHELNPVLPAVDRVLYLVDGRWAAGTPRDILTPRRLSKLYGTPVDVLKVRGRTIVMGAGEEAVSEIGGHHHHPPAHHRRHR